MQRFKITDFWISCILFAGFTIASLINRDFTFIIGYIVVGSWQVISMIVHAITHTFTRRLGARYIYHWITCIAIATMPLGSIWILLFTAPVMALYYTWLCYNEVFVKMKRPLYLLK